MPDYLQFITLLSIIEVLFFNYYVLSRIFITSDWHLNHEAILDFENRKVGYEKEIIRKINNQVKENDILINLGDVIFSNQSELTTYLQQIQCKNKILVRGNHDKGSFDFYINKGFSFVCDEFLLNRQGKRIIFSHIPRDIPEDTINVHGHLHSGIHRDYNTSERHFLYNPEKSGHNFVPILLQNLLGNKKSLKSI